MSASGPSRSPRQLELLEAAYRYVLQHGLADLSLRPLAAAVGSSPRVLLFLFGSKDGLIAALLQRARADELALLDRLRAARAPGPLPAVAEAVWSWLVTPAHRALLVLWLEAYSRSLVEPHGPWAGFAAGTVRDWLAVLENVAAEPAGPDRTLVLAVLRGALLDLLATGDVERTTAAVRSFLRLLDARVSARPPAPPR